MENAQAEKLNTKPEFSKLAIAAAIIGFLDVIISPVFIEYFPHIYVSLRFISLIPIALGGWSCVVIIKSNGKLKGIIFSIIGIVFALYN